MTRPQCSNCKHCEQRGRQNFQRGSFGRKRYWCEHPKAKDLPSTAFGNASERFIGFGEHTYDSPLKLKTHPRWCPISNNQKPLTVNETENNGGRKTNE